MAKISERELRNHNPHADPHQDHLGAGIMREISNVVAEVHARMRAAMRSRSEWLEDVLAGLLAAGCSREEIEVQYHPDCRVVVCVQGVPKYEWTLEIINSRDSRGE